MDDIIKEYLEKESEKKYYSDNKSQKSDPLLVNNLFNPIKINNTEKSIFMNEKTSTLIQSLQNKNHYRLKLKNLSGNLLKGNNDIIINEQGIENLTPLRKAYDGITKFGVNDDNDFEIELPEKIANSIQTLFTIEYNNLIKKFILNPCNFYGISEDEFLIFVKVENYVIIEQKLLFSLGDVDFSVEVKNNFVLYIELNSDNYKEIYSFGSSKKIIRIGRCKECDIILKGAAFSRVQCTLFFNEEDESWYIQDGDGISGKGSMNGTWLYVNFPFQINYENQFRIGKNLIEIKYI